MNRFALFGVTLVVGVVSAQAQSTRDSAGIRIVTNDRPAWAPAAALRLGASPTLVIGDQAGDRYDLSRVMGTLRLTDGTVVVADGGSVELRFFDSTGTYLRSAGRRGDGPGEFRQILTLARLPGDTIAVVTFLGVSLFTGDGTFARYLARPSQLPSPPSLAIAVFPGGARFMAAEGRPSTRTRGTWWVEPMLLLRVDGANTETRELGRLPGFQLVMEDHSRTIWFGPTMTFTNDARRFFYGFGNEYSISVFTPEGRLTSIIRRAWTSVKVTKGDIDTFITEWGKRWIRSTGAEAENKRADLRDDPYSPTAPAFSQFMVDAAGRLWVREAHVRDAAWAGQLDGVPIIPSKWSVFDADGRWLCDVEMPARFLPKDIGRDYVLGVARGAEDVETVVRYRLTGGGR